MFVSLENNRWLRLFVVGLSGKFKCNDLACVPGGRHRCHTGNRCMLRIASKPNTNSILKEFMSIFLVSCNFSEMVGATEVVAT